MGGVLRAPIYFCNVGGSGGGGAGALLLQILDWLFLYATQVSTAAPAITAGQAVPAPNVPTLPQSALDELSEANLRAKLKATLGAFTFTDINVLEDIRKSRECKCATRDDVYSHAKFLGNVDIACNLGCNNGVFEETTYYFLNIAAGVELHLLDKASGITNGVFLYPGQGIMTQRNLDDLRRQLKLPDNAPLPDLGINEIDHDIDSFDRNTTRGGLILVRQPGVGGGTRADRLATFVEEIGHAALYHSPWCPTIKNYENELIAKAFKQTWIARSGLNVAPTMGVEGVRRPGELAFKNCPNERAVSLALFLSGATC